MSNKSLVSIIIPFYSGPEFLQEAVASALGQTNANIEVIVVDDCGPGQRAQTVLNSFSDSRLRLIVHEKNAGAAAARNTAGRAANGEFILPLDADDKLDPAYVETTLPYFENPKIGGVYTAVKMFGAEDSVYAPEWTVNGILTGEAGALVCVLYRKTLFDQLEGYDTRWRVGEDSDFYLRAVAKGWLFQRLEKPLYLYRKHEESVTFHHAAKSQMEMGQNLLRYHKQLCEQHMEQMIAYKDKRYWDLDGEYKHLHSEFHKLLALYDNLNEGLKKAQPLGLIGRIKRRIGLK
ncbi:MAG: glycosyltransferase [Candidatus Obscuribacterales bacterium]|nr:glycosyltransferase [Candidatus Obscuribacterales bacterium]